MSELFGQQQAAGMNRPSVADPGKRFVAFLIDSAIPLVVYFIAVATKASAIILIVALAMIAYFVYNSIYLTGTTGQSIGKKQQGIKVLRSDTGQPIGMGMAFVRVILQSIFAIPCYLDHWFILVDKDKRRISDKVLNMHVYQA